MFDVYIDMCYIQFLRYQCETKYNDSGRNQTWILSEDTARSMAQHLYGSNRTSSNDFDTISGDNNNSNNIGQLNRMSRRQICTMLETTAITKIQQIATLKDRHYHKHQHQQSMLSSDNNSNNDNHLATSQTKHTTLETETETTCAPNTLLFMQTIHADNDNLYAQNNINTNTNTIRSTNNTQKTKVCFCHYGLYSVHYIPF